MDCARYLDHTVLKPETVRATVARFCDEARDADRLIAAGATRLGASSGPAHVDGPAKGPT